MRKELHLIRNTAGIIVLLLLGSCRSSDSENTLSSSGSSAVNINLMGTDYASPDKLSIRGISNRGHNLESEQETQRHNMLITPGSVITAELSPSYELPNNSGQASSVIKPVAVVSDAPLANDIMFRVIAYRKSNGNYHTHQDYTVGQTAVPMMLDNQVDYNIVVYSFGMPSLPGITGEKNNYSSASVNYNDSQRDFMYQNISFKPDNYANNTLNIKLRHKVAKITTKVNSGRLGTITNISGGVLTPHFSNGVVALSTGVINGRSATTSGSVLNFTGLNTGIVTADPVFVNGDTAGEAKGGFSATMTVGGVTKAYSLSNFFKITPETKSDLTITLIKCGAYIGPNLATDYKEFMCHNLGANYNADPFKPSPEIHGAKYQYGYKPSDPTKSDDRYLTQADDQDVNLSPSWDWNKTSLPDGSWSDTTKKNDPCPDGYRIPTRAQWEAVVSNNTLESTGTWGNSATNYLAASYFIKASNGNARTLMLPAAGFRSKDNFTGAFIIVRRGDGGYYWSSSPYENSTTLSAVLYTTRGGASFPIGYRESNADSIRCIKE